MIRFHSLQLFIAFIPLGVSPFAVRSRYTNTRASTELRVRIQGTDYNRSVLEMHLVTPSLTLSNNHSLKSLVALYRPYLVHAGLVRDYIAYAREFCNLKLTQEAAMILKEYILHEPQVRRYTQTPDQWQTVLRA
jgi:DNA replicative helicase MCM subunit Mcm2 (Cdc46/Mcm family)